jgi:hypothetical protein
MRDRAENSLKISKKKIRDAAKTRKEETGDIHT